MTKKKKVIITILAALLLLAGARYAQKSYQKHQVFSNGDFLSAEEKIYGLSVIWDTAKTYYGMSRNSLFASMVLAVWDCSRSSTFCVRFFVSMM